MLYLAEGVVHENIEFLLGTFKNKCRDFVFFIDA
jgi:hypothetical protein